MSRYGTYSLQLRQKRQEQLRRRKEKQRKEKVRRQATKLIAESRQMSRQSPNNITAHFSRDVRQKTDTLIQQAERSLQSDPDQALKLARKSRATVERGMAEASRKTDEWSQEKIAAEESVTILQLALVSTLDSFTANNDDNISQLQPITNQLAAAKTALRREDFESTKRLAVIGQEQINQIEQSRRQQQEQEEVRREIVHSLHDVLTKMNFTVERPCLGEGDEEGRVVLVGNLPSGRRARFVIALDGHVQYDFDGYPHRECRKDSDKIRRQLEQRCQCETSDIESYWKDGPDLRGGAGRCLNTKRQRSA
jgi:hypothetical protein